MRRNGFKIMFSLTSLIGSLSYIILFAIINGSIGFLFSIFITIFGAIGVAKLMGAVISISWLVLFVLLIGFGLMRGILRYIEQYCNHYIAFRLLATLRDKIFSALRKLCPAKLETKQKGSIISMITSDIETLEVFYAHTISPIFIAITVSTTMAIFIGLFSSWYLSLVAIIGYLIICLLLPLINSNLLAKDGVAYRQNFSKFNGFMTDIIKGKNEIVLYGNELTKMKEIKQKTIELNLNSKILKRKISIFEAISTAMITLINLTFLLIGIYLVNEKMLSIANLVVGQVALMSSFGPVIALNMLPNYLNQTFASGERVLNLFEETPVVLDIENKEDVDFESLDIKNLCFSYNDKDKVLNNVNLVVNKGDIVGIKGKSGCGKSTLLKLLLRFWDKNNGNILINEKDILLINTKSLKQNVVMVSQSTYLVDDTILNNLQIANEKASIEDIENACKKASIDDFIQNLPEKYNTKIGQCGLSLSAGETQRIGLARAFVSNAKLILLDEPTSNVDAINEGIILNAIKNNKEKTFIIVSHRDSTLSIANKVFKFNEGGLIND